MNTGRADGRGFVGRRSSDHAERPAPSEIKVQVLSEVAGPHGPLTTLDATLHYSADDPFAINIHFPRGGGVGTTWTLGRDLLASGLEAPSGEGEFRVIPLGDELVRIHQRHPGLSTDIDFDHDDLSAFLTSVRALVPDGKEHEHLDLDAALDRLFAETD